MFDNTWEQLASPTPPALYRSVRCDNDSYFGLLLAKNLKGNRCLIFNISDKFTIDFSAIRKNHISLTFEKGLSCLVLSLENSDFNDLFNDLAFSFNNAIKNEKSLDKATQIFIKIFLKWNVFFEKITERNLSKNVVLGLFGELFKLNKLLHSPMGIDSINDVLTSWRGPYDEVHDFDFKDSSLEVKTKTISSGAIQISSEFQLERKNNKKLSLLVLSIEEDVINGIPISHLFLEIKKFITSQNGNLELFISALHQLGINHKSILLYDNWRFIAINSCEYDCEHIDFPRLTSSSIPISIRDVKYSIYLNELEKFLIKKEVF